MRDPLADLAAFDRDNRPWADPRRGFDYSEKRLKRRLERMKAKEVLAELRAKGMTFSVRKGRLWTGPEEMLVNGTAQKIDKWREHLIELVVAECIP